MEHDDLRINENEDQQARLEILGLAASLVSMGHALTEAANPSKDVDVKAIVQVVVGMDLAETMVLHIIGEHTNCTSEMVDEICDELKAQMDKHEVTHKHEGPVDPMGTERKEKAGDN